MEASCKKSDDNDPAKIARSLRGKLRRYLARTLEPIGFVKCKEGPAWLRKNHTLNQNVASQFIRGARVRITYGYNFSGADEFWSMISPDPENQKLLEPLNERLQVQEEDCFTFCADKEFEIPRSIDELDILLAEVADFVTNTVLPFYQKYNEAADIRSDYDAGIIDAKYINLHGRPWFSYNLGLLRYQEGKYAESLVCFRQFLVDIDDSVKWNKVNFPEEWSFWEAMGKFVELVCNAIEKRV